MPVVQQRQQLQLSIPPFRRKLYIHVNPCSCAYAGEGIHFEIL